MRTKLSAFCDKVLEAGWLLALIVTPLFFNVYSSRVFEPDKLSILRSIALVMVVAWAIKVIDGSGWGEKASSTLTEEGPERSLWQRLNATPLVLPTIMLVSAYILSTIISVAPRISLWGSYMRLQGTYTTLSYIVIFFFMLGAMRRREQVDRLCSTVILTSLPISLYGILQHYHLDSLPWSGDVVMRVASNMGNAIFVAAYLIMALPVTLARLVESFSALMKEEEGSISHALLAGAYTFVISVQLICIFFAQSRGPWLGLLGGLYVFGLVGLISLRRGSAAQASWKGRLWIVWVALTLVAVLFLVLLNVPNSPLAHFRELPYLGRMAQILNTEAGTGKVRVLIWEGTIELIRSNLPRALVGYGPETMHVVYNPFYPPDLAHYEARNASPDRSHNETFDALVITGVSGFLIYMLLFASIFYYGLKWLGFMETKVQRNLFLLLSVSGATVGVFLPKLTEGTYKLSGVGLPVGFIVGTCLYLMVSAALFFTREQPTDFGRQVLLIGLFAAIVAHFIEIHFGIAIASTRTYFWAYTAVFVLLGLNRIQQQSGVPAALAEHPPAPQPAFPTRRARRRSRRESRQGRAPAVAQTQRTRFPVTSRLVAGSLIVAVVLFTLGFEFIANPMGELDPLRVIQLSLTTLAPKQDFRTSYGVLWMFFLTWVVGALVVLSETERTVPERQLARWWLSGLGTYTAVTLGVLVVGLGIHTSLIIPAPGADITRTFTFYYAALGALLLMLALALLQGTRPPNRLWQMAYTWAYAIGIAAVVFAIFVTNISIVKADIYYKQGLKIEEEAGTLVDQERLDEARQYFDSSIRLYNRAISMAQDQDYYYLFLGRALMGKSTVAADAAERVRGMEDSFKALDRARQLNPLNTDHYANLGRLERNWADNVTTAEERAQRLELAHTYYQEATRLSPHNAQIANEWALVYLAQGDLDGAQAKIDYSFSLDRLYGLTYLIQGNLYRYQSRWQEAADEWKLALIYEPTNAEAYSGLGIFYAQQGNITDALTSAQEAVRLNPSLPEAHSVLGLVYSRMGQLQEAVDENLLVLRRFPSDFFSHRNLALLYQQLGQIDNAIAHAQSALSVAPESERASLQAFIDQLNAQQLAPQPQP
jgi:tetratricopeptide (TPR) repeat protein